MIGREIQPQTISLSFPLCVSYIEVGIWAFLYVITLLIKWTHVFEWYMARFALKERTPQHCKHISHGPLTFTSETLS